MENAWRFQCVITQETLWLIRRVWNKKVTTTKIYLYQSRRKVYSGSYSWTPQEERKTSILSQMARLPFFRKHLGTIVIIPQKQHCFEGLQTNTRSLTLEIRKGSAVARLCWHASHDESMSRSLYNTRMLLDHVTCEMVSTGDYSHSCNVRWTSMQCLQEVCFKTQDIHRTPINCKSINTSVLGVFVKQQTKQQHHL